MLARDFATATPGVGSKKKMRDMQANVYFGFAVFAFLVYMTFHDIGLSTFLTLSVVIQALALTLLRVHIHVYQQVTGLSGKLFICQAFVYACRLSSTLWLRGYVPVDTTGDWLYQLSDIAALCLTLQILHCIYVQYRPTYMDHEDNFPVTYLIGGCFVLAALIHPDLNDRHLFDTLWTASLYIDVVACIPQLWMLNRVADECDAVSSHFVAVSAFARFINLVFWCYGYVELARDDGSFNFAGWTILTATLVQNALLADFVYLYVKGMARRAALVLGGSRGLTL
jgi:hypothetical protein